MPLVLNLRHSRTFPTNVKKVDRSTPYGNPFVMKDEGHRDIVCDEFKTWVNLPAQAALRQQAKRELKGFNLACWCAPKRCHAETWICIANEE